MDGVCLYLLNWVRGSTKAYVQQKELAYQSSVDSLKTSVSNGKSAVASAITDKGVSTSATATFNTMAANIRAISSLKSETRVIEHKIQWPNQSNPYRIDVTFGYSPVCVLVNYPNYDQHMGCVNFFLQQDTLVNVLVRGPGFSWNGAEYLKCLLSGNTAYVCSGDYSYVGEETIIVTFTTYYQ